MFRNPVVVTGYPILRRPTGNPGLEVPLNVMAGLIGGQRINELMGNCYIKGLRSMLVTSGNTTGIFNWHHLVNSNERRISYLYGRRHQAKSVLASSSSLAAARHIVGWCPNVSHQVGESVISDLHTNEGDLSTTNQLSPVSWVLVAVHVVFVRYYRTHKIW